MTWLRWLAISFGLVSTAFAAPAQQVTAPHVSIELIAENSAIEPGRTFSAGVLFTLEKGWHVYWLNPGDSGSPPKIEWHLPAGFQAGDIQWPAPKRLPLQSLMDFGYENQVLLMTAISAPKQLNAGPVPLAATVKWVVCSEVCIAGKGDVALALPIVRTAAQPSADQKLFLSTLEQLPKPAPATLHLRGASTSVSFVISGRRSRPVHSLEFFPAEPLQIESAAPQALTQEPNGRFCLAVKKAEQMTRPLATLRGLLVVDGQAYTVVLPLTAGKKNSCSPVPTPRI